jgi:uncharacterized protein (DUF433 family)
MLPDVVIVMALARWHYMQQTEYKAQLVTEVVGGESYRYYPLGEYIVRAPGVCGGRPTFKYTRIEVSGVLDRLASSESIDELVHAYRGRISQAAIVEAIHLVTDQFVESLPALEAVQVV